MSLCNPSVVELSNVTGRAGHTGSRTSRVLHRFYRREKSRTVSGSGLELRPVAAIIAHHGFDLVIAHARLELRDRSHPTQRQCRPSGQ